MDDASDLQAYTAICIGQMRSKNRFATMIIVGAFYSWLAMKCKWYCCNIIDITVGFIFQVSYCLSCGNCVVSFGD